MSIREVAKRAGVSRATVSRVLNNGTEGLVALHTRDRVRQIADELGYHPSAVARGLAGKPMNTIGVVLAYDLPSVTSDPYLGPVLDGILHIDKKLHQKTVIFTEDNWVDALRNVPTYCDGHCDGLIVIVPLIDSEIVQALKKNGRPFLILGDSREDPDLTTVDVDNAAAACDIVHCLIENGHKRIAALCGNDAFTSSAQRLQGYRTALEQNCISPDEKLILPGQYWEWSGYENTQKLLKLPKNLLPTALFCEDDRIAHGALRALAEAHIQVPESISIVGISDYAESSLSNPPLTTMKLPNRLVGERAVETLYAQIHNNLAPGKKILLEGERVVRGSVSAPPSS